MTAAELATMWGDVKRDVRPRSPSAEALLHGVTPVKVSGGVVTLVAQSDFHRNTLGQPAIRKIVEDVLSRRLGARHTITIEVRRPE